MGEELKPSPEEAEVWARHRKCCRWLEWDECDEYGRKVFPLSRILL